MLKGHHSFNLGLNERGLAYRLPSAKPLSSYGEAPILSATNCRVREGDTETDRIPSKPVIGQFPRSLHLGGGASLNFTRTQKGNRFPADAATTATARWCK